MKHYFHISPVFFLTILLLSCGSTQLGGFKPIKFDGGTKAPLDLLNLLKLSSFQSEREVIGKKRGLTPVIPPGNKKDNKKIYTQSYAVVIGIDDYHYWPKLDSARNDAYAMENILQGLGFTVYRLYDRQATKDNIQRMLTDIIGRKADLNDQVLIFFAGHGHTLKMDSGGDLGYIVPVDAKTTEYSTMISMTNLLDWSRIIKARQLLFIMDSCYSGLGKLTEYSLDLPTGNQLCKTRQIITAGQKDQQIFDSGGSSRHSVFTNHLIDALKSKVADEDKDGLTTASELGQYLFREVTRDTRHQQIPDFGQLPEHECGEFAFQQHQTQVIDSPARCDIFPDKVDFEFSRQIEIHGKINQIQFNPIFNNLIAVASDNRLLIWDLNQKQKILDLNKATTNIAFSPSGECLVAVDNEGNITFWDARHGEQIHRANIPLSPIYSLAFNPNSTKLAIGGRDKIYIWNMLANAPEAIIEAHHGAIHSLSFVGKNRLLSIGEDLTTKFFNLNTQKEIKSVSDAGDMQQSYTAAFSADGSTMAIGAKQMNIDLVRGIRVDSEHIRLRNTDTGDDVWTFEDHSDDITSLAFHANKHYLASGSLDSTVNFWDTRDRKKFKVMRLDNPIDAITFSPNGCWFAAGSGGAVSVWKITE